ncbi:MAG TPA: NTP transferase domain-containing protein [Candidatus Baltobacteraceae bacterium]|nr:NTP transferase domain-containing protein [Candidatus Baltobacteraceae bacterium]
MQPSSSYRSAVITAGGTVDEPFARRIGTPYKALARVRGTALIDRTISALRGGGIERIGVVAPDEVADVCRKSVDFIVTAKEHGGANQWLALNAFEFDTPFVYATCDMPYIDSNAVSWFVERAGLREVSMALTEFADFEKRFPKAPPFGIKLGGERVVNGGLFAVPAYASHMLEAIGITLFNARKNPLKMARIAGPGILLRYLVGNLGVGDIEYRAKQLLTIPARALRNAPPELAYDVDVLEEYEYADTHA